jgi:hypothetical protein
MAQTLLQIVQDTAYIVGMPAPSGVVSANSETPKRMLRLINEEGRALAREHAWSALTINATFATDTVSTVQTGNPPSDFDRFSPETQLWDVAKRRPLIGVVSQNAWMRLLIDTVSAADRFWAMQGGVINITPVSGTADTIRYSYQTKNWVRPASGSDKESFTLDTDTPLIPDHLLKLGLVWRWKHAIGTDYAEDLSTYGREKEKAISADRGTGEIPMSESFHGQIPDGFWPGTITST